MSVLSLSIDAVERGLVPDPIVRGAIRRLCARRLRSCGSGRDPISARADATFRDSMKSGPVALVPEKANEQHYELPPEFFALVLGPHRKYSCCFWSENSATLVAAEEAALELTCDRAGLQDGQEILELGCGWGSLSLWIADRYPRSRILAVSNSQPQRLFIEAQAKTRGLTNLQVTTADINRFSGPAGRFDRVVSVEMFEHMRNYEELLRRISSWMRADGRLFVHHFCHRQYAYPFETEGDANWMGRYFFTGGLMPDERLLDRFDSHLQVESRWQWNGRHYEKTANAWLERLDAHRPEVLSVLAAAVGAGQAKRWMNRWRMFFLAVAELFGYAGGQEWFVAHALMKPAGRS